MFGLKNCVAYLSYIWHTTRTVALYWFQVEIYMSILYVCIFFISIWLFLFYIFMNSQAGIIIWATLVQDTFFTCTTSDKLHRKSHCPTYLCRLDFLGSITTSSCGIWRSWYCVWSFFLSFGMIWQALYRIWDVAKCTALSLIKGHLYVIVIVISKTILLI